MHSPGYIPLLIEQRNRSPELPVLLSPNLLFSIAGIQTKVLYGDPSKAGFYSILLFVPANTTIQAHSHRDDRMVTVVSGNWQFGYGSRFDEKALKTLPPGSVYSEPKGKDHFARTGNESVVVQISGYGPTDTRYLDSKNDPSSREKN